MPPTWRLTSGSTKALAIPLERAKQHLRVDFPDDDGLIDLYIWAAQEACERATGLAMVRRRFTLSLDRFPAGAVPIALPKPPLVSLVEVVWDAGAPSRYSSDPWVLSGRRDPTRNATIAPRPGQTWPRVEAHPGAVKVTYYAGLLGHSPELEAAMLLLIGSFYEHREDLLVGQTSRALPRAAEDSFAAHAVASVNALWEPFR